MIGTLMLTASLSSSLIQPVFGHLSDRSARAWLLPFGVIVATLGMAGIGLTSHYTTLLLLIFVSGVGIASYHPEAYKTAYLFTGEKKATGISLFSVGGGIGYGLGPLVVAFCLTSFGQPGLVLLLIPGLLVGALFCWALPWLARESPQVTQQQQITSATSAYAITLVLAIVTLGACAHSGLVTYVPLYYTARGEGAIAVGSILSLLLIAGAIGTLIAGPVSDRVGHKKFLVWSMGALCPLMMLFLSVSGTTSVIVLALIGMCISPMFSVTLVIAQALMRGRLGMTAGLMTGLGIGAGGLCVMGLGMIADRWGVDMTMRLIGLLPLLPWGLILLLPASDQAKEAALPDLQVAAAQSE
jgi:FSR family fosmidomycin resistance protein-like MFS transporter